MNAALSVDAQGLLGALKREINPEAQREIFEQLLQALVPGNGLGLLELTEAVYPDGLCDLFARLHKLGYFYSSPEALADLYLHSFGECWPLKCNQEAFDSVMSKLLLRGEVRFAKLTVESIFERVRQAEEGMQIASTIFAS